LLDAHHELLAPTLLGHYGAATPGGPEPVTVQGLLDAIEADLDRSGLDKVHVVGNSLGGRLALELARRGRARSVVALSPAAAAERRSDVWSAQIAARLFMRLAPRIDPSGALVRRPRGRKLLFGRMVHRPELLTAVEVVEGLRGFVGATAAKEILDDLLRQPDIEPLQDTGCPILIAWAERDQVIPFERYGRPLLKLVPEARHVILPTVGHVPMSDDPELVARTILETTLAVDGAATRPRP
jgi:pimeloyl-ACP methyl ester carboxylesterase